MSVMRLLSQLLSQHAWDIFPTGHQRKFCPTGGNDARGVSRSAILYPLLPTRGHELVRTEHS